MADLRLPAAAIDAGLDRTFTGDVFRQLLVIALLEILLVIIAAISLMIAYDGEPSITAYIPAKRGRGRHRVDPALNGPTRELQTIGSGT